LLEAALPCINAGNPDKAKMSLSEPGSSAGSPTGKYFSTTHWSVVLEAGQKDAPGAEKALERLCQTYWYPLYVFIRRKGHPPHDAQDLTQEFFARFLEKNYVSLADQSRGKFRTFLLRSLEHFLINEWTKAQTAKRGGPHKTLSWDEQEAERRFSAEAVDGIPPDKAFEKRWAMSLLDEVMAQLGTEFSGTDKRRLYEALKGSVMGDQSTVSYQEIGASQGMAEGAVKVAAHRMRQRYRELLRAEVGRTVATSAEVDEELRYLAGVLRS
jgi:RNA polymerase sigma-70 factor (ECF subfamily)